MTLPKGAIILIDEAQFTFSKRPNGSRLPDFYEKLAVHRHSGYDIFLATQHPSLLDNFVRQLVGQHYHAVRKFGLERNTIYEWSVCNPAPQSATSQKSAVALKWAFPKEVYGWYKSAEVHTVKKRVPAKLVLACLFVVAIVCGVGYKLTHVTGKRPEISGVQASPVAPVAPLAPGLGSVAGGSAAAKSFDPVQDAKEYVWKQTPRVAGLPQTAPKYDQMTQPTHVPVPAMCIQRGTVQKEGSCKCWSQQATPLDVPYNMCLEFARNGYFREFDADRESQQVARGEAAQRVLSNRPEAAIPEHVVQAGPSVVVMPGQPMGPQRTDKSPGLNEGGVIQDGPPNNRATRAAAGQTVAGL